MPNYCAQPDLVRLIWNCTKGTHFVQISPRTRNDDYYGDKTKQIS